MESQPARQDVEGMRAWIREHKVSWRLEPHVELHQRQRIQVGFDLTLAAVHPEPLGTVIGSDAFRAHYEKLRAIALATLPRQAGATRCDVAPFDGSVHLGPESSWTPEIELHLTILHSDATFAQVDEEERRCAAEIQDGLRRLGVRPGNGPGGESLNRGH
jgi:hypothetical protein